MVEGTQFAQHAERMLQLIDDVYEGNFIVLSPLPIVNDGTDSDNFTVSEINGVLLDLCASHNWEFVSVYDAFSYIVNNSRYPLGACYIDGLHPNKTGTDILYAVLKQVLYL